MRPVESSARTRTSNASPTGGLLTLTSSGARFPRNQTRSDLYLQRSGDRVRQRRIMHDSNVWPIGSIEFKHCRCPADGRRQERRRSVNILRLHVADHRQICGVHARREVRECLRRDESHRRLPSQRRPVPAISVAGRWDGKAEMGVDRSQKISAAASLASPVDPKRQRIAEANPRANPKRRDADAKLPRVSHPVGIA